MVLTAMTPMLRSLHRQSGAGVKPEPAERQDQGTGHAHRDLVARDGVGSAVLFILADPRPRGP